jgi:hypothetical protein
MTTSLIRWNPAADLYRDRLDRLFDRAFSG